MRITSVFWYLCFTSPTKSPGKRRQSTRRILKSMIVSSSIIRLSVNEVPSVRAACETSQICKPTGEIGNVEISRADLKDLEAYTTQHHLEALCRSRIGIQTLAVQLGLILMSEITI